MRSISVHQRGTGAFAIILFLVIIQLVDGLSQEYCSNENTGSGYNGEYNVWQSNGACFTQCQSEYAFAIVQGNMCWCSNYAPANQLSISSCGSNCPGFPPEQCGSPSDNLYGYVALSLSPSGTAGASSATSSMQTASSTESTPSSTPSSTPTPTSSIFTTVSPVAMISTMSSSQTPTPIISTQVETIGGGVVTRTVTSTPTVAPDSGSTSIQPTKKVGLSGGTTAGIAIGSVAGFALLAGLAFGIFVWCRRRRNGGEDDPESRRSPKRNTSVLSRTGLLNETREKPGVPALTVNTITRRSSTNMLDPSTATSTPMRRNSQPLIYDQRLNPSALMMANDNGSRVSVGTMQDNRDYTRPLNVMNPDPPDRD